MALLPGHIGRAAAAGRKITTALLATCLLCACATATPERKGSVPAPPAFTQTADISSLPLPDSGARAGTPAHAALQEDALPQRSTGAGLVKANCSIKDRFDRKMTLSYRFAGGRSQLGLKVSGNVLQGAPDGAMVSFSYKLQQPGKRERVTCLYDSPLQGLIGSAYNEFFLRQHDTVWNALEDTGLDFWDRDD